MILPSTIPMLLNCGYDKTVKLILSNPDDHLQNINRLSKICNVKIKFNQPVTIYLNSRRTLNNVTEHIFTDFFLKGDSIFYRFKKNGRHGLYLPMQFIKSYEPVIETVNNFKSYEEFRKKFDTFFITEEFIKQLWNEKSAQTEKKYRPSDFKSISRSGKKALTKFLMKFQGVNCTDTKTYHEISYNGEKPYHIINSYENGTGGSSTSRDIKIEHRMGLNRVFYSSEYHDCGNGRYGIVANRSTYLWLEDD